MSTTLSLCHYFNDNLGSSNFANSVVGDGFIPLLILSTIVVKSAMSDRF